MEVIKTFLNKVLWSIVAVAFAIPFWFVRADGHGTIVDEDTTINITLDNPINVGSIESFVEKILDIVITIGVPIVAIFIIYSGCAFCNLFIFKQITAD